ncbi:MAG TPA: methyltransferase domain-containing protein [Candidatus Acidoferrales bacterium]|nr:methyltransferase domain-containing protein [Candidatus Acidoferrales bacterium]
MPEPTSINYAHVAHRYDKSRRIEPAILSALVTGLRSLDARSVLEIGAGTGNYSRALVASGFSLTAVDREPAMLAVGAAKATASWIVADALHLPLPDRSFDAAVAVNVLHHLPDLGCALAELRRVARRGAVMHAVVRENLATLWFRRYFPEIDDVLLPLHPPLGRLITALFRVGFSSVASTRVFYSGSGDLTFEAARTQPHLIFDSNFRAAVSGFRRLSSASVARGLVELERDLDSGAFASIAASFDSAHAAVGDCVVVTAH